jgi:RNA polymerase sigma factor (sigma-70 family)
MASDETIHLQHLLDRLRQGDDSARRELIGCAYDRLRLLARNVLHQEFPRIDQLHDTGSVLHQAAIQLLKALEHEHPATLGAFFALAAKKTREVLLDVVRRSRRRGGEVRGFGAADGKDTSSTPLFEPTDTSHDPADLAQWTEFHEKVDELPERERAVVDLHWYQGLTQAEAGEILGLIQKEVSRLYIQAFQKLRDYVP